MNPILLYFGFRAAGPITKMLGYLVMLAVIVYVLWFIGLGLDLAIIVGIVLLIALSLMRKRREHQIVQQRQMQGQRR